MSSHLAGLSSRAATVAELPRASRAASSTRLCDLKLRVFGCRSHTDVKICRKGALSAADLRSEQVRHAPTDLVEQSVAFRLIRKRYRGFRQSGQSQQHAFQLRPVLPD